MKQIFLFVILLVALPVYAIAPERPQTPKIAVLNLNTLKPISSISYKQNIVFGAMSEDLFANLKYRTIIKCLAKYESNYNINAVGKAGERGILQYMPQTFATFCEGTWENPQDQLTCCDQMLQTDFGLISHWTTSQFCY